jgi:hypothetical protein
MRTDRFELASSALTSSTLKWLHRIQCGFNQDLYHHASNAKFSISHRFFVWKICWRRYTQCFLLDKSCRKMYTIFSTVLRQLMKSDVMTSSGLSARSAVYYIWNRFPIHFIINWPCSSTVITMDIWRMTFRLENRRNMTQVGIHMSKSSNINFDLLIAGMVLKHEPSSMTWQNLRSLPLKASTWGLLD